MPSEQPIWRRAGLVVLTVTALAQIALAPVHALAPRIAIVKSSSIAPFEEAMKAMIDVLGQHSPQPEILIFDLGGDFSRRAAVMAEVLHADPRLIVTVGSLATTAVLAQERSMPVVFSMVLYPRQSGFVAAPARAVTGASLDIPFDVQFSYLRRLLPRAHRLGVLYNPGETGSVVEDARTAATRFGFTIVSEAIDDPAHALAGMSRLIVSVDAVLAVADSHVFTPLTTSELILAAVRQRIPLIGLSAAHVRAGAVAAFTCDYGDVGKQTADLVVQVLAGARAEHLPITSVRTARLALNLRTADHIGLSISGELRAEASEVIQ